MRTIQSVRQILDSRPIAEPPTGRRKARLECHWCDGPVIETKWICDKCWKCLPLAMRKKFQGIRKLGKLVGHGNRDLYRTWIEEVVRAFDYLEKDNGQKT